MFFSVNKMNNNLNIYEETDFKTLNVLERNHIEKWVIEKPEILGEDLYILTNEYDKFDKTSERLDVLAMDRQGNLVIIELKRDDSGRSVELQAIKYAAYCSTLTVEEVVKLHREYLGGSNQHVSEEEVRNRIEEFIGAQMETITDRPRIILVSREYRAEVTATVLWLRKFGIDITCVKFTVYNLNESEIGVTSTILIPLPEAEEYIIRAEKKDITEIENSIQDKVKSEFLNHVKSAIKDELNVDENMLNLNFKQKYLQIKTNQPGVHFEYCFRRRNSLEIGLHFEKNNDDINNQKVTGLKVSLEDALTDNMGEKVVFEEDWTSRKWARVYIMNDSGVVDDQLHKWAIERMKTFYDTLVSEL